MISRPSLKEILKEVLSAGKGRGTSNSNPQEKEEFQ